MKTCMKKLTALLMAAVLMCTLAVPGILAAENTITIKTVEDLMDLSRNCTLDTWSRGKTVILGNDLDLQRTDFTPIPTFGGTFQGNGHKISGLKLGGSGNVRGLFRYIQSGATVQDLTVAGTIHPSDRQNDLGLLAGSNAGRVLNCAGLGTIIGDNRIGGLIGTNETGGELVSSRFSGSVTGKHSAGGVVGENHGTMTRCENSGSINTKDLEDNPKTDYTGLAQLNSMDNIPAYTDIGGVVGLSDGTVQSCVNTGTVGYDQIGYNIGGVAGRSSGWLDGCTNTGAVAGRKDVGGIVGQLEPEVLKTFSQDFLDKLLTQLDSLQDIMDRTANHADSISDSVHHQMNDLSAKTRTVKDIAKDLTDAMTDWANGNIDQINELSARISWSLDQLDDIMDDAVGLTKELDTLISELEKVRKSLLSASGVGDAAADDFQNALSDLKEAADAIAGALPGITSAMKDVISAINRGDPDEISAALVELAASLDGLGGAIGPLTNALVSIGKALGTLMSFSSAVKNALNQLEFVNKAATRVNDRLTDVAVGLNDMIHELSEKPDIKIDPIGPEITDKGDALNDAMDALLDSGDALNRLLDDSADTLIGDLKAVNSQFRSITNLIRSEKSDWEADRDKSLEDQIKDRFQDLSDTCDLEKQHDGRVSGSENSGTVTGNTNIGGILGSIGLELDFSVEDDVTKVGDSSLNFRYQARALVSGCVNNGAVAGKDDYSGGIVGLAELGRVTACESYAAISTDGSYAGGITGSSYGSVDNSWAKCSVSAADYVGGIAGYAETLTDCRALTTLTADAYVGAIAGDVSDDATVSGNRFAGEIPGGIDGISYAGLAEPVDFDTLCADENVPKAFTQLELTFRADGQIVEVVPFQYGRALDRLPDIPAKKGCSAAWPDIDYTCLTASQTLDAIYTPYTSALTDSADGLPQLLVDGSFSSNATVSHTTEPVTWTDEKNVTRSGEAVTVTVEDPDLLEISYTVHYRLPDTGKRYDLWVKTETGWEKQDNTVDGSYLLFTSDRETVTFCVQERTASPLLWVLLAVLNLLALMLAVIRIRKKRGLPRHRLLKKLRNARSAKHDKEALPK
ncbi:hypothetical protein [Neopoerus faecalis]|uniref:hypothetical protein n=1 Tax=Neopoerus faecalis TaxID=3032125 RepID=UPI00257043F6|nr:hypothetical protein [Neopoerus faecalis]